MSRIFLTFDDGPDPDWTLRILDLLGQAQARATFFVIGAQAQREPQLLRQVASAGHAIGNHTYSHRHPWTMNEQAARREVRDGSAAISDVLGHACGFYRAPHGRDRACMTDEARQLGETSVGWDRSAIDWGLMGTGARIAARLRRTQPGDIVLMHDGRNRHNRPDELVRALPSFLEGVRSRGWAAVSLDRAFVV